MLQSIREYTQGWFAGIIISLLILSFALWGIHSYLTGSSGTLVVAKVNGVEISKSQFAMTYERMRRQLQMQFSASTMPENAEMKLKQNALQALVDIQVLKQASLKQDYRISSEQIDSYLESMPEFRVNGQFSVERFQQIIATTLFNAHDFLELIKTSLLIDQPRLGLIFTSFALPNEIEQAIALINEDRDIAYASLPVSNFLHQPITISEEKVTAYYEAHQNEFKTPEEVNISYLQLSIKDLMNAIHPTEQMLKAFYDENTNSFAQPMQIKLESLLIPVKETASEAEAKEIETKAKETAKQLSQGANIKSFGSQYPATPATEALNGWISINKIPSPLQKPILGLTKQNPVSVPMRVREGFLIVKAADFKDAVVQPFTQIKNKVQETLVRQQAEEKFANLKEKLANVAYEHPDSLEAAAKLLGVTIRTSELFSKDKGGKDISSNPKIREAAFSNDVLNLQNNSDLIQPDADTIIVLRVKSHSPATLLSLKAVEKQIQDKLKMLEADAKAKAQAEEILLKLQKGSTMEEIAKYYPLSWNTAGYLGRHSNKISLSILETAFTLPKPEAGKVIYGIAKEPSAYVIVALKDVREGNIKNNREQYEVFAEQVQSAQGMLEYELFKQSLMHQAKIVIEDNSLNGSQES